MKMPSAAHTRIVAAVLLVSTVYLYQHSLRLSEDLRRTQWQNDMNATKRGDTNVKLYHQNKELESLVHKLDVASNQLASAEEWLETSRRVSNSSEIALEALEEILAEPEERVEESTAAFLGRLIGRFTRGHLADSTSPEAYDLKYEGLNEALNLTDEKARAVREIVRAYQESLIRRSNDIMDGRSDTQYHEAESTRQSALLEVLGKDEIDALKKFEHEIPARMFRKTHEKTMAMYAPDLSPENRKRTLDVLVEEKLIADGEAQKRDPLGALQPEAINEQLNSDIAVLAATLGRLSSAMDDDQALILTKYIRGQIATQRSAQSVVRFMAQNGGRL